MPALRISRYRVAAEATAPFGTLGRNVVSGFPFYQTNLIVVKHFPIRAINESAKVSFRGEFYNLFNQTNFSAPTTDFSSAAFGQVGSTLDPRYIQLALKLSF
jgi:hypothetical protein